MSISRCLLVGGSGFVGLNLAETLLRQGREVTLFDRAPPPPAAVAAFAALPGRLEVVAGDVRDEAALAAAIGPGLDALVMGAAITANAERDAREPETILGVNLMAPIPLLRLARDAGVQRVVNLSSAAAYGRTGERSEPLREDDPCEPESLYAITKWTSERVAARLAALWQLDVVSVRLSAVFGPWEYATGVRDTLSPQAQILAHAAAARPALLPRPGLRDWIYAPDVATALLRLFDAPTLAHRTYNISSPHTFTALAWGERLAGARPGFVCRLAGAGEPANVDLHGPFDRAPLDISRLRDELGWEARFGLEAAMDDLMARTDRGHAT